MSTPWDQPWFGEAYARLTEPEDPAERAADEVAYLRKVLGEDGPGRRVIDLGCGTGRRAIALARARFEVVGVDVSAWAIGEAVRRGDAAGVAVCWQVADLLSVGRWPFAQADAVICLDSLGLGSDADQRRLLRRLRRHLAPNGILVLGTADPFWEVLHLQGRITRAVGRATYRLEQAYDAGTGRLRRTIAVSAPPGPDRSESFDRRLYAAHELKALAQEAGFRVERLDTEFGLAGPAAVPRSSQLVARPLPTPPTALAVATWSTPPEPGLELRYAPDETPWLDPSPDAIWRDVLRSEVDAAGFYPVDDPYGAERGAPVVGEHFGCALPPHLLTFAAGVTPLLRDLSGLAEGGLVLAPELSHPDIEAWTVASGGEARLIEGPATPDRLIAAVERLRPAMVHLDRPTAAGDLFGFSDLRAVCQAASRAGAVVVIDESPASCLGPARSAARLVREADNLVVLRGLTKSCSCPGLRVGFALASEFIAPRVRELVAPLQVAELSFRAALRLLAAGDIFGPFRARVATVKPEMIGLLEASAFEVIRGHPELPWVLVRDPQQAAARRLRQLGIRGLRPASSPAGDGTAWPFIHLSVPLSDQRIATLKACLRGASSLPREITASTRHTVG